MLRINSTFLLTVVDMLMKRRNVYRKYFDLILPRKA